MCYAQVLHSLMPISIILPSTLYISIFWDDFATVCVISRAVFLVTVTGLLAVPGASCESVIASSMGGGWWKSLSVFHPLPQCPTGALRRVGKLRCVGGYDSPKDTELAPGGGGNKTLVVCSPGPFLASKLHLQDQP